MPSMSSSPPDAPRPLPDLVETSTDEERPSITEVNGTVARFEMSYAAPTGSERIAFGPPLLQRLPSLAYLAFCVAIVAVVGWAHTTTSSSWLHDWIIVGDERRPMSSLHLAAVLLASGCGVVLRTELRGVVVTATGVETRDLAVLGMPRIRRYTWPQIDRLILDGTDVVVELWNGEYDRFPRVARSRELSGLLAGLAEARKKTVTVLE